MPILSSATTERIVYCYSADVTGWMGNVFNAEKLYTGKVIDGKMEEIETTDLRQGDIIHFLPVMPEAEVGSLAIVHGVLPGGSVVLGNPHITTEILKVLNDLYVKR